MWFDVLEKEQFSLEKVFEVYPQKSVQTLALYIE